MRMKIADLILAVVVVGTPSLGRAGIVVSGAVWSGTVSGENCYTGGLCGEVSGFVTGPGVLAVGYGTVTGTTSPPTILATVAVPAISTGLPGLEASSGVADAKLLYNIEVVCSGTFTSCAVSVPIGALGVGAVSSSTATGSSEVELFVGSSSPFLDAVSTNGLATGSGVIFSGTGGFFTYTGMVGSLSTNFEYTVELDADSDASTNLGAQSASAFIDPFFFVDPSFPDAQQYSILTSPGIGNIAPVPEPPTWMMLLTGMAGLGLLFCSQYCYSGKSGK